jgi:hypothetical protein
MNLKRAMSTGMHSISRFVRGLTSFPASDGGLNLTHLRDIARAIGASPSGVRGAVTIAIVNQLHARGWVGDAGNVHPVTLYRFPLRDVVTIEIARVVEIFFPTDTTLATLSRDRDEVVVSTHGHFYREERGNIYDERGAFLVARADMWREFGQPPVAAEQEPARGARLGEVRAREARQDYGEHEVMEAVPPQMLGVLAPLVVPIRRDGYLDQEALVAMITGAAAAEGVMISSSTHSLITNLIREAAALSLEGQDHCCVCSGSVALIKCIQCAAFTCATCYRHPSMRAHAKCPTCRLPADDQERLRRHDPARKLRSAWLTAVAIAKSLPEPIDLGDDPLAMDHVRVIKQLGLEAKIEARVLDRATAHPKSLHKWVYDALIPVMLSARSAYTDARVTCEEAGARKEGEDTHEAGGGDAGASADEDCCLEVLHAIARVVSARSSLRP